MSKRKCFLIHSLIELENLLQHKKDKRKFLIIFLSNYIVRGFGVDWLNSFLKLVKKKYSSYNIKFYVDAGRDYGLSLLILREDIDYLKINTNKVIMSKIKQIAKQNKVLLNPAFNIVDLSRIKNYEKLKL